MKHYLVPNIFYKFHFLRKYIHFSYKLNKKEMSSLNEWENRGIRPYCMQKSMHFLWETRQEITHFYLEKLFCFYIPNNILSFTFIYDWAGKERSSSSSKYLYIFYNSTHVFFYKRFLKKGKMTFFLSFQTFTNINSKQIKGYLDQAVVRSWYINSRVITPEIFLTNNSKYVTQKQLGFGSCDVTGNSFSDFYGKF